MSNADGLDYRTRRFIRTCLASRLRVSDRADDALFRFQRMKETFHDRIVPAVSPPTHGRRQSVTGQQLAVPDGGVLKPAVRMMHHTARRSSVFHGHGERCCGRLLFVGLAPSLAGERGNWITGDFLLPAP